MRVPCGYTSSRCKTGRPVRGGRGSPSMLKDKRRLLELERAAKPSDKGGNLEEVNFAHLLVEVLEGKHYPIKIWARPGACGWMVTVHDLACIYGNPHYLTRISKKTKSDPHAYFFILTCPI